MTSMVSDLRLVQIFSCVYILHHLATFTRVTDIQNRTAEPVSVVIMQYSEIQMTAKYACSLQTLSSE